MEFYHEIVPAFNWWMVVLPLEMVLMFVYGTMFKWHMSRSLKINDLDRGNKRISGLAIILDLGFMALLVSESFAGLLQFSLNHLGGSDPLWGIVMLAIMLVGIALCVGAILYSAAVLGGSITHQVLLRRKRKHMFF